MINTNPEKIKEVLERGVSEVVVKEELQKKLLSGKSLRIYFGIDPTSPNLHLGHTVVLRKLRAFQDLGHEVILLIGDFTARIGDPTQRDAARVPLTEKQVKDNFKDYKKQAAKVLDFKKLKVKYNSQWLSKLNFADIIKLASNFTVQQMLARDMFARRMQENKPINLQEFLYPLMQGYDSVYMDVDLEVAGNDQIFNALAGRDLQKIYHNKDKDVLTTKLLLGTDGRKMSKTFGNTISLSDSPNDMFGKVMSMQDQLIYDYFDLCTGVPLQELAEIKNKLASGQNPRDIKARLAKEIVAMYNGKDAAEKAEKEFDSVFRNKEMPTDIPTFETAKENYPILDLLFDAKLTDSKSEAKRLVEGGGVEINKQKIQDWKQEIKIEDGMIIQAGKRKFIKIKKI